MGLLRFYAACFGACSGRTRSLVQLARRRLRRGSNTTGSSLPLRLDRSAPRGRIRPIVVLTERAVLRLRLSASRRGSQFRV